MEGLPYKLRGSKGRIHIGERSPRWEFILKRVSQLKERYPIVIESISEGVTGRESTISESSLYGRGELMNKLI